MGRAKAMEELMRRAQQNAGEAVNWTDLCQRIDDGLVIPIVGNGLVNELLFPLTEEDLREVEPGKENLLGWSIEEYQSVFWAKSIEYPLPESHVLSRVALFDRVVNSQDERQAKTRYLDWLKDFFLTLAQLENGNADRIAELRDELGRRSLSFMAAELGYPKPVDGGVSTLDLLARLNLPIYITTSPFDLLERAIANNKRTPRTQICFWRGTEPLNWLDATHKTDYGFKPTKEQPLVYHMFGLEAYPESMVLSEEDYLDFITALAKDTNADKPVVPLYLRDAITQSSLILLGFRLRDADLRVLFRGLINEMPSAKRQHSLAVQIDPRQRSQVVSTEKLVNYLKRYFGDSKFAIEWNSPQGFATKLWQEYDKWRG